MSMMGTRVVRVDTGFMELVGPVWSKREGEERPYGFVAEARHLRA